MVFLHLIFFLTLHLFRKISKPLTYLNKLITILMFYLKEEKPNLEFPEAHKSYERTLSTGDCLTAYHSL
jgi:hypothetical protein